MRILCTLAFLWFGLVSSSFVYASTVHCTQLYNTKKYEKAGQCFWKAANQIGDPKRASSIKKYAKGRLLRNAFQSYTRIKTKKYDNIQSIYKKLKNIIRQYTQESLYEDNTRKHSLQKKLERWIQQKTILTKSKASHVIFKSQHPSALLTLSGATLTRQLKHQGGVWKLKLKPGTYQLTLKYPGIPKLRKALVVGVQPQQTFSYQPPSATLQANSAPSGADVYVNGSLRGRTPIQFLVPDGKLEVVFKKGCHTIIRKSVSIQPQEKKTVSGILRPESIYLDWIKSSKAANQSRILGWVGILTGAAVYGLTVGSFIASNQARTEANKARDNYLGSRQQPEQHIPTYQSAAQLNNTWQTIGYISAGVGSASLGLGIFGLVSARTKSLSSLNCQVSMRTNTTLRNSQK